MQLDKRFESVVLCSKCPNIMKLATSDGVVFEIDSKLAKLSGFLTDIVNKPGYKSNGEPILLSNIASPVMKKVIEWAEHHKNDPQANQAGMGENSTAWDSQFLRVDQKMLCQLILAATHLRMDKLMDLVCKNA